MNLDFPNLQTEERVNRDMFAWYAGFLGITLSALRALSPTELVHMVNGRFAHRFPGKGQTIQWVGGPSSTGPGQGAGNPMTRAEMEALLEVITLDADDPTTADSDRSNT